MRRLLALMLIAVPAWAQPLPTVQLKAGMHIIRAEVAADFATRAQGLMHRKSLGQNDGMLFVRSSTSPTCGRTASSLTARRSPRVTRWR